MQRAWSLIRERGPSNTHILTGLEHSELGVDLGATGLDKYGTKCPRFGLLAGRKDLVGRIRVKGFEFGMEARQMLYPAVVRTLEQYDPARVRELIATSKKIADERE